MATNKRRRVDDDENNATAAANAPPGAPTTPATTNSGGTPGLKGAKPGDSSGSEGTLAGANGAANKKRRMAWSAEATALGYEAGTIKNSAYVLLAQSGVAGMTVAAIVEAATKQGLYSWGTCKTPNNSVTAALSQDTTFVRIAPSTYALRSTLKGGAGPVPQPRTSSGSINSGLGSINSGLSGGAVAGGRSTLGQKAISSKARRIDRAAAARERQLRAAEAARDAGYGMDDDGFGGHGVMDGGATVSLMHAAPSLLMAETADGVRMGLVASGYDDAGNVRNVSYGGGSYGGVDARREYGGHASKLSSALHLESYRRRTDLLGGLDEDTWPDEDDRLTGCAFATLPAARPEHDMEEATAGSSLLWYPTANPPAPPPEKPSPLTEPTEALIRASSWKDEAKSLFSSPGARNFESEAGLSAMSSGHLPKWVLESFNDGKGSPGAVAC